MSENLNKTDLRVGNIVSRKFWNPIPDNSKFSYSDCIICTIGEINTVVKHGFQDKNRMKVHYEYLFPVKINAHWLHFLGFEVDATVGGFVRWTKGNFKLIDAKLAEMQNMKTN